MMKVKILLRIIVFLIFLSSCAPKEEGVIEEREGITSTAIKIGVSSALSGHASFLGTQYIRGALIYINEINKTGIHGRRIQLISYDDQYDSPQTVANTQKLINQDKVFALFNYVGTSTSVQVKDIIDEAKIPALGFFTGAEALRVPFSSYLFHVRDSYYSEAESIIAYFYDVLGLKKIAVMYQEDDFGLAVLSGCQIALRKRNDAPVVTATYERGTMDVEKALESIKEKEVEAVIMVGTYSPLAKFIKITNNSGMKPYFATVSFVGSEAFAEAIIKEQKVETSEYPKIIVTQVVPSPFDENFSAVKEYRELSEKYYPEDKLNYVALEGFINAKVLVEALKNTGNALTRENFIKSLESLKDFDIGIDKKIEYSSDNHVGLKGVYYSRLNRNKVFETFVP